MPDTCPHAWTYPRPGVRECWRCGATEMLPQDGELEHHEEPRRYCMCLTPLVWSHIEVSLTAGKPSTHSSRCTRCGLEPWTSPALHTRRYVHQQSGEIVQEGT